MDAVVVEPAFPAGAGMNRNFRMDTVAALCVPRRRGDEPHYGPLANMLVMRSPQARG